MAIVSAARRRREGASQVAEQAPPLDVGHAWRLGFFSRLNGARARSPASWPGWASDAFLDGQAAAAEELAAQ